MRLRNTGKRSGQKEVWYSDAPPRTQKIKTDDGSIQKEEIVIKTWQKLPSDLLEEWCTKKKRPKPLYLQAKSFQENVLRFRVILRPPAVNHKGARNEDEDGAERTAITAQQDDLVFSPFESTLKSKKAVIAKEEAAIVAYFCVFTSPDLALVEKDEQKEHAKAAKNRRFVPSVSEKLHQSPEFAEVLRVLPDPWKGFWYHMAKGTKGCMQVERWLSAPGNDGKDGSDDDEDEQSGAQSGTASASSYKAPVIQKPLSAAGAAATAANTAKQPEVVILNKITRAQETEREFFAEQAVQPIYFAKKLRKEALKALRVEQELEDQSAAWLEKLKEYEKEELLEDGEDVLDDAASTAPSTAAQSSLLGLSKIEEQLENKRIQKLLKHYVLKVGFDPRDVIAAILMTKSGTDEEVQTFLSTNIPEEFLPEEFKVRGQFQTYAKLSSTFNPADRTNHAAGSTTALAPTPGNKNDASATGSTTSTSKKNKNFEKFRDEIEAQLAPLIAKEGKFGFLGLWKRYEDENENEMKNKQLKSDHELIAIDTGKSGLVSQHLGAGGNTSGDRKLAKHLNSQQNNSVIRGTIGAAAAKSPSTKTSGTFRPSSRTEPLKNSSDHQAQNDYNGSASSSASSSSGKDNRAAGIKKEHPSVRIKGWAKSFLQSREHQNGQQVEHFLQIIEMFSAGISLDNAGAAARHTVDHGPDQYQNEIATGLDSCCEIFQAENLSEAFVENFRRKWKQEFEESAKEINHDDEELDDPPIESDDTTPAAHHDGEGSSSATSSSSAVFTKTGAAMTSRQNDDDDNDLRTKPKEQVFTNERFLKDYRYEYGSWFQGSPYFGMEVQELCTTDSSASTSHGEASMTNSSAYGEVSMTNHASTQINVEEPDWNDPGWWWDKKQKKWRHEAMEKAAKAAKQKSGASSHPTSKSNTGAAPSSTSSAHRSLINNPAVLNSLKHRGNKDLPAFKMKQKFRELVAEQDVTLVLGQTGCGKSTQLPQFLQGNIVCTQPRKLAAISLAQRVASERGESLVQQSSGAGVVNRATSNTNSVGYCVRGDVNIPKTTELVFCTVGVLIRKLLEDNIDFTHLVIDEAHERSLDIDFLLMLVANHFRHCRNSSAATSGAGGASSSKPKFKLIIMSATLDQNIFDMFPDSKRLEIPGRTFPVETYYAREFLNNYDLTKPNSEIDYEGIARCVHLVRNHGKFDHWEFLEQEQDDEVENYNPDKKNQYQQGEKIFKGKGKNEGKRKFRRRYGKAILIFMPGVGEINKMCRVLKGEDRDFRMIDEGDNSMTALPCDSVLPLHASLPQFEQKKCFKVFDGKVVISTNVCETSITIPDVTCVIDCCREKRLTLRKPGDSVDGDVGRTTEMLNTSNSNTSDALDDDTIDFLQSSASEMQTLRLPVLQEKFCSKASIEQRKGRAGRVQPGICIRMISRSYAEKKLEASTEAEMDILPLENIILQLLVGLQDEKSQKILTGGGGGTTSSSGAGGRNENVTTSTTTPRAIPTSTSSVKNKNTKRAAQLDIIDTFKECLKYAPSPPVDDAITIGLTELESLGAIEYQQVVGSTTTNTAPQYLSKQLRVTPLGHLLVKLPMDARLGKLLIYASILGCPIEGASLVAMLSVKNPLQKIWTKQEAEKRLHYRRKYLKPGGTKSDHCFLASLLLVKEKYNLSDDYFADELKVLPGSIKDGLKLRKQYLQSMAHLGFLYQQDARAVATSRSSAFLDHASRRNNKSSGVARSSSPSPNWQWHLLKAAVTSSFFLVKTVKPAPTFRKIGLGSSTVMDLPDPMLTKYFQLERDPFAYKVNAMSTKSGTKSVTSQVVKAKSMKISEGTTKISKREDGDLFPPEAGKISAQPRLVPDVDADETCGAGSEQKQLLLKYQQQKNPLRYLTNANSLFHFEGPSPETSYMVHTNLFLDQQSKKLTLDTVSEATPLAVLLLATFFEIEWKPNGIISIDDGKLMFTTVGTANVAQQLLGANNSSSSSGGLQSAAKGASSSSSSYAAKVNNRISFLIKRLRYELRENVLKKKIADPFGFDIYAADDGSSSSEILQVVRKILATDGMGGATTS
ncbi:unnamed protein product [Amoebophrya sp. A120]|nr:unnamed protein product [Amoebophrya sp. A120]|eukprot:GSA120T00022213001.1